MNLLDYPIPELDMTLQEVGRVLQLTLPPDLYLEYKTTLDQQRQLLEDAQQKLACRAAGQENWVTEQFKKALLSCADPLPTSTALPVVLLPAKEKACSQLSRAAGLLWAAAKLCAEPLLLEGNAAMERTQQSEAFSACRLPGTDQDQFKVYPDSLHAIVTCSAGVFPVDILWRPSPEEPMSACSFTHIYSQLAQVMAQPCAGEHNGALTVCSLSGLDRKTWAGIRQQILGQGGVAAEAMEVMESAVLALSLEERNAPTDLADILNAVRLGAEEGPCLRYYDKVTNLVVFRDSTAGMLFEHTGVDGMVACLVAKGIYDLSETVDFSRVHGDSPNLNGSVTSVVPVSLTLPLEGVKYQPSSNRKRTYPILSFDLPSYPDVLATLSGHRGLYDAWITFSLQLSLRQTQGESASNHILVTPTHMRHYKHGRCDPTYSLTSHSRRLIDAIASSMSPDNTVQCTSELLQLFHVAFLEHKALIKNTKNGRGVGPHLAALRRSLPSDNPLRRFFDPFGCPSVYLSGTLLDGVECVVGNVYAQNQLSVTYFGKKDRVRILLNAKGTFTQTLDNLKENMKSNLQLIQLIALRYSIACQMGALECLLQKGQTDKMNGELRYTDSTHSSNIKQNNHDFALNTSPNYKLLIHGGAGEDMMLNPLVVSIIEFALETALTVGSQVLQQGGKSVDAVQRSVEALENCFLFNAGKGSVFNKEGKHELEASIVDGRSMKSGSVACVEHVKNPIKAARSIMDKCQHALLVGQGAEEFWQGQGEKDKPVDSKYFHTYIRHGQLTAKLSNDNYQKNNHPQTVGAVALDVGQDLAAATSTGGLVGKLKGRVGDTAVVGAGVYADNSLAVSCSGDGDMFLRQSVAQKIASLYHNKGYSLRQACREVIEDNLKGVCAGVIAVDRKGNTVIETNAGVMFVGSMINGIPRVEAFRPIKSVSHAIWESDELVAYLHPNPWTPGATILTRKALSGAKSIFSLPLPDYMVMLEAAKTVSQMLCQRFAAQRCSLVFYPSQDHPAQIRLLPLHGLSPKWQPHLAADEEFHTCDPGFCTSKSGPKWNSEELTKVQTRIKKGLPTPNAPPCFDFHGDPDYDDLFSRIVRGVQPQWRVWEDSSHVAFLTPYPNTPGCTVIVPRKPLPSDIFSLDNADYKALILATYKVARLIQEGMQARAVAMIFEGFEIDYAHTKLIPLLSAPNDAKLGKIQVESFETYPGYVSSVDGPCADLDNLKTVHAKITQCRPPHSWQLPQSHATTAIKSDWYRNLFQIQNTLFHSTVEYFHNNCQYSYALTPLTTDTISSPMGLGSDSEPVSINLLGHDVYLADSMQFVLEYFLRFQDDLPGAYYISPSFRGEDPDNTHLNQFYHVECELLGNMDNAISIAEGYIAHLTKAMLKKHSDIILKTAGSLSHTTALLSKLEGKNSLPRVSLDEAIPMMTSPDCLEWVQDGQPQFGRKLTRKGEHLLIEKFGGAVWLTEMDHLAVPFYQAYVESSGRRKAKAADLLIGLGETVGLGERHSSPALVQDSLRHHAVPEDSYKWYISMRQIKPLLTSGWGMGTERFLCWLLQHDDIRDMHIIPRMKGTKYMP
ncbi:uncharacterized protein si:ch211-256m1.8 [Periophthalmus magnuspinnatus]|uniref:uncharacterized protein si:ch211-256m1.8 n=1 Tax=Periophthalmus magnuspinnatus TaxID=409849 RepID=UPI0024374083|nr:uncharacterized protein si:ch211-256m1.8 [Periophthalmus magnuspinnatus]